MYFYEVMAGGAYDANWNCFLAKNTQEDLDLFYNEFMELKIPNINAPMYAHTQTFVKWLIDVKDFQKLEPSFIILES